MLYRSSFLFQTLWRSLYQSPSGPRIVGPEPDWLIQRINEERPKQKEEQLKRRLSTSDDELILVIEDGSNVISTTTTTKIMKTNDGCDYSSEDIENIIDDSAELSQLSIDL